MFLLQYLKDRKFIKLKKELLVKRKLLSLLENIQAPDSYYFDQRLNHLKRITEIEFEIEEYFKNV